MTVSTAAVCGVIVEKADLGVMLGVARAMKLDFSEHADKGTLITLLDGKLSAADEGAPAPEHGEARSVDRPRLRLPAHQG